MKIDHTQTSQPTGWDNLFTYDYGTTKMTIKYFHYKIVEEDE